MNNTNVNPDEIAKFSALASEWWDVNGPMKPLHALNPLRLSYVEKFGSLAGKKVLDIGCGGGILTESLAKAGAIATGIDMSADAIHAAMAHAKLSETTVDYQKVRTEDFADNHPNTFDVVTCMEMLEHVPDPLSIIRAASQLVKPSGFIFFSTIHRNAKSFLSAIIGAEYILKLLPKGTHHYKQFIRPSELTQWAEKNDLSLRDLQGIGYRPFSNTFVFSSAVDVNYLVAFQKI